MCFLSKFFGDFSIRLHTILFAEKRLCLSFKQHKFTIFNLGYFRPLFLSKKRCQEILNLELKYSQKLPLIYMYTDIPLFFFIKYKFALSNITLCLLSWFLYYIVAQNMLRTHEAKSIFEEEKIRFLTAIQIPYTNQRKVVATYVSTYF